jgi:MerR family transcriptional regulator, light-induced transcriptional regulator
MSNKLLYSPLTAVTFSGEALYPIRTVARLTGVNPITLRAWERRYKLINPIRTPKGHRLYSQQDIELIHQLVELLDKGVPISQARLALHQPEQKWISSTAPVTCCEMESLWQRYVQRALLAIKHYNEILLEEIYTEALSLYPIDEVTNGLLLPLLEQLNKPWEKGEGMVSEGHFFSVFLRHKIGARFHHRTRPKSGIRLIAGCFPQERQELRLLLLVLSAHSLGYEGVVLGGDVPFMELPSVVKRSGSEGILLYSSVVPSLRLIAHDLATLIKKVGVPVFVAGTTSVRYRDEITRAGAVALGNDIEQALKYLKKIMDNRASFTINNSLI